MTKEEMETVRMKLAGLADRNEREEEEEFDGGK